jgi:hypothetical protein
MEDKGEKTTEQQNKVGVPERVEAKPIFSQREIRSIIKDFITAWLSGQIKLILPTCEEILQTAKQAGDKLDYKQALARELETKADFRNSIGICSGTIKATSEEQQKAVSDMFDMILSLRNGDRIEGKFMDYELEQRIQRLEEGLSITNNLVQEIIDWLYKGRTEHG